MTKVYRDDIVLISTSIIAITFICGLMIYLNTVHQNLCDSNISFMFNRKHRRSNTYEFDPSGSSYDLSAKGASKPFQLELLFILFDVEVRFLTIIVLNFCSSLVYSQTIGVWFFLFIVMTLWIEMYSNAIIFYPYKKNDSLL